jgi:transcription antitermination factor NusG
MMHYRIGDRLPLEGHGILGNPLPDGPRWFIFRTPPMREMRAQGFLMRNGALEAWHPTVTEWVPAKGLKPRRKKIPIIRRVAPGYVFALFDREPRFHILFEAARGRVSRVVTSGGKPLELPDRIIAAMQHVPERLLEAQKEADEERYRAWLARQPVAGEAADVKAGALIGHTVDVLEIHGGLAKCLAYGVREIWVEAKSLERRT